LNFNLLKLAAFILVPKYPIAESLVKIRPVLFKIIYVNNVNNKNNNNKDSQTDSQTAQILKMSPAKLADA